MLEQQPLINGKQQQRVCTPITILTTLTIILTLVFSLVAMIFSIKSYGKDTTIIQNNPTLPAKFKVDSDYILPPTNQMNIGSCWCFSMIYLLESQYHAQGVREGLLDKNEYVQFSKQAFFTWLGDQCHKNPVKPCYYGGLMQNSSEDGQIESIYYFAKAWEETKTAVLPESVCPYRQKPENDPDWKFMYCPNLYYALGEKQNPIKWDIKSIEAAYNLDDVKRLLKKANRALGIGSPLPNLVYYIPCENGPFSETEECKNRQVSCPEYVGQEYCYKLELDGRQQDGVFLGDIDPMFMSELGGHAMNLVGYNDDWVYRNRYQTQKSATPTKGGLILHNSWRGEGHSVEYYMGEMSEENEAVICPNHKTPFNWIPASLDCIKNNIVNGKFDYTKCSTETKRIRGKGYTNGTDILRCKATAAKKGVCDTESTYVLLTKDSDSDVPDVQALPYGLNKIRVARIAANGDVSEITFSQYPFWALSQVFQPDDSTFVPNDENNCGYWMLPYQTLENMRRLNWDFLDNFRVFDFHVEFAPQSYIRHADSKPFNHTLIKESTKRVNKVEFDGPIPYQYIF